MDQGEAEFVAAEISRLHRADVGRAFCSLYRTNFQSRSLEEAFGGWVRYRLSADSVSTSARRLKMRWPTPAWRCTPTTMWRFFAF